MSEACAPPHAPHSGARGRLRLGFAARYGCTRLVDAYQSGCLRARTPRCEAGEAAGVVLINTGGGVAGGDSLELQVRWRPGADACVATQAAEKVYRSTGADSVVATRLEVASGARAEWLPQETILFDRSRLRRSMEIDLADGATLTAVEAVVLGRSAMGERVSSGALRDAWRIRRQGRLIYADAQKLAGDMDAAMARPAIGGGARAMAMVIHAAASAPSLLGPVREALGRCEGRAAASAWNGLLVVRCLADDGQALRRDVTTALAVLRGGRPLPRVWTC